MRLDRTWQITAVAGAAGLAMAAVAVAAAGPWQSGQRTAERARAAAADHRTDTSAHRARPHTAPPPPSAAPVLLPASPAAGVSAGRAPGSAPLAGRLDALLAAPGLGPVRTGAVVDVTTGQLVYGRRPTTATTPASITKIATAVAVLGTLGPQHRFSTTVVTTGPGRIVLVGGGDPTFDPHGLAEQTAAVLRAEGTTSVRLGYDASYFAAPALHPIGHNDNLAPVTALMVREARLDGTSAGPAPRSYDPAASAAAAFAQLLRSHGVAVTGQVGPASGAGGAQLAASQSPPLADLVERMLTNSDNDLGEALARQVAHATGRRTDFAGGAAAIRAVLTRYGVPLGGAVFTDGSGLSHGDALAPATVARLLALAADPAHPELRSVLTGLPVAAFTGTLRHRFHGSPAAGYLHGKTGTLTGTNTIAGTAVRPDGHVWAFCFMTQGTTSPPDAESALDRLATAVLG